MKQIKTFTILPFTKEIYQKFFKAGVIKQKNVTEKGIYYKNKLISVTNNGFESWLSYEDNSLEDKFDKGELKKFRDLLAELRMVFYDFQVCYCGHYQYLREKADTDDLLKNRGIFAALHDFKIGNKRYWFDEIAEIVKIDKELKKLNKLKYCELDKYAVKVSHKVRENKTIKIN